LSQKSVYRRVIITTEDKLHIAVSLHYTCTVLVCSANPNKFANNLTWSSY